MQKYLKSCYTSTLGEFSWWRLHNWIYPLCLFAVAFSSFWFEWLFCQFKLVTDWPLKKIINLSINYPMEMLCDLSWIHPFERIVWGPLSPLRTERVKQWPMYSFAWRSKWWEKHFSISQCNKHKSDCSGWLGWIQRHSVYIDSDLNFDRPVTDSQCPPPFHAHQFIKAQITERRLYLLYRLKTALGVPPHTQISQDKSTS